MLDGFTGGGGGFPRDWREVKNDVAPTVICARLLVSSSARRILIVCDWCVIL